MQKRSIQTEHNLNYFIVINITKSKRKKWALEHYQREMKICVRMNSFFYKQNNNSLNLTMYSPVVKKHLIANYVILVNSNTTPTNYGNIINSSKAIIRSTEFHFSFEYYVEHCIWCFIALHFTSTCHTLLWMYELATKIYVVQTLCVDSFTMHVTLLEEVLNVRINLHTNYSHR